MAGMVAYDITLLKHLHHKNGDYNCHRQNEVIVTLTTSINLT